MTIGAALTSVGSCLDWVSWGPFSVSGLEGDGWITLFLAGVALAMGVLWWVKLRSRWLAGVALGSAALILATTGYDASHIMDENMGVGSGLWLAMLGGVTILGGSIVGLVNRRAGT